MNPVRDKAEQRADDQIDLSGAGPFTDAVLRYLLVRYGVTPRKLREVRGPTRFGDVL